VGSNPTLSAGIWRGTARDMDRCPSGLRSTIGNRVGLTALEGSNPSLSVGSVPEPREWRVYGE
jgi:hypothetical protein